MSYEENIICPHCNSTYSSEPYEYYDSDGEELECDDCGKNFILEVTTTISFSTSKADCEEDHDMDHENPEIRIIDQKLCDRWNREKFLLSDKRTKWEPHKTVTIKCKNCEYEEREDFPLRKSCEKYSHKWGKPYGKNIRSLKGNYNTKKVDCIHCDQINFVDKNGNIEFTHI